MVWLSWVAGWVLQGYWIQGKVNKYKVKEDTDGQS